VRAEMDRTNEVWRTHVEPLLPELLGLDQVRWISGEEWNQSEIERLLDIDHVTDGMLEVWGSRGRRSYQAAKRVQFAKREAPDAIHPTITIRVDRLDGGRTEIDKIPEVGCTHLHLQAYMNFTGDRLSGIFMARSQLVYEVLRPEEIVNPYDGTIFRAAHWQDLRRDKMSRHWIHPELRHLWIK
jgi:hypothetical protein